MGFESAQGSLDLPEKSSETTEETDGNYRFDFMNEVPQKIVKPPSKRPQK